MTQYHKFPTQYHKLPTQYHKLIMATGNVGDVICFWLSTFFGSFVSFVVSLSVVSGTGATFSVGEGSSSVPLIVDSPADFGPTLLVSSN